MELQFFEEQNDELVNEYGHYGGGVCAFVCIMTLLETLQLMLLVSDRQVIYYSSQTTAKMYDMNSFKVINNYVMLRPLFSLMSYFEWQLNRLSKCKGKIFFMQSICRSHLKPYSSCLR